MKHECDCGARYDTEQAVISCGDRNHGRPNYPTRERLIELLRKAQRRLQNQGDVPYFTGRVNFLLSDEIEKELGGSIFLAESYYPAEKP